MDGVQTAALMLYVLVVAGYVGLLVAVKYAGQKAHEAIVA